MLAERGVVAPRRCSSSSSRAIFLADRQTILSLYLARSFALSRKNIYTHTHAAAARCCRYYNTDDDDDDGCTHARCSGARRIIFSLALSVVAADRSLLTHSGELGNLVDGGLGGCRDVG